MPLSLNFMLDVIQLKACTKNAGRLCDMDTQFHGVALYFFKSKGHYYWNSPHP